METELEGSDPDSQNNLVWRSVFDSPHYAAKLIRIDPETGADWVPIQVAYQL